MRDGNLQLRQSLQTVQDLWITTKISNDVRDNVKLHENPKAISFSSLSCGNSTLFETCRGFLQKSARFTTQGLQGWLTCALSKNSPDLDLRCFSRWTFCSAPKTSEFHFHPTFSTINLVVIYTDYNDKLNFTCEGKSTRTRLNCLYNSFTLPLHFLWLKVRE
jgi:hypothetical protein